LRFDEYLDLALYDPDGGFYTGTGGAGRHRDFLTSPEVGPLFGAVLARAVDTWWEEAGRPARWTVVDAGAGSGRLLAALTAAEPRCSEALHPVAVDRSARQRADHSEAVESRVELPDGPFAGVVVANELLDNMPWRLLEREADGWSEIGVGIDLDGGLVEVTLPADAEIDGRARTLAPEATVGARIPIQDRAAGWLEEALTVVGPGRVAVFDYGSTTADMASRPWRQWLRTFRLHRPGGAPLHGPGAQDVTVEVAVDQLEAVRVPDRHRRQADFLAAHGLDELVAEGRRVWTERADRGDLEAVRGRSRIGEAEALTDRTGLGGFRVLEWVT
jgi:SAM-dependent MidA family methyltransferase